MQSMVDVVVAKYMRPAQATEFMEYLLRLALYDLEEVWMDECAALTVKLTDAERVANINMLRGKGLERVMHEMTAKCDALEAEIIRLKEGKHDDSAQAGADLPVQ